MPPDAQHRPRHRRNVRDTLAPDLTAIGGGRIEPRCIQTDSSCCDYCCSSLVNRANQPSRCPYDSAGACQVADGDEPGEALITWDAVPGATGYSVRWMNVNAATLLQRLGGPWQDIIESIDFAEGGEDSYTLTLKNLAPGTVYAFGVGSKFGQSTSTELVGVDYVEVGGFRWRHGRVRHRPTAVRCLVDSEPCPLVGSRRVCADSWRYDTGIAHSRRGAYRTAQDRLSSTVGDPQGERQQ